MITFENNGRIDIRSIKTFGVNSKANKKSAIGYFGTGLKYAIAILLRNNHRVKIISGGVEYNFDVVTTTIRNDDFELITMNGEELGFTTELGKDWEMWMAFREIYSNMLDEGGKAYPGQHAISTENTYVMVEGPEMEKLYLSRDKYFLNQDKHKPIAFHDEVDIYPRTNRCMDSAGSVFFKGVRVMETRLAAMYDYNHKVGLTLSEDRTIKDSWSTLWHVATAVLQSQDKKFIKAMVMAPETSYESRLNFRSVADIHTFLDVVGELRTRYKDIGINCSAVDLHKTHRKVQHVMPRKSCPLNRIEQQQWDKALAFCKGALNLDLDKYLVIVCEDIGKQDVMGLANIEEGIMYISKFAFRKGTKAVATAILEEYTHCHFEVHDETLQQKWVYLDQIIGLGEQLAGEPL